MPRDEATIRPILRQDEDRYDHPRRAEAELPGDEPAEARLHVLATQRLLEIAEARLHLEDGEHPLCGVPADEIASATVAEMIEADLGMRDSARMLQPLCCLRDEACVLLVDEAVDLGAMPSDLNDKVGLERGNDPIQRADRDAAELVCLDPLHDVSRQSGSRPEILLSPPAT